MSECTATKRVGKAKFACTRTQGHAGRHEAKGVDGVIVYSWSRPREPGARAPGGYCMDCGKWTVWGSDGTMVIRHKEGCPNG